MNDQSLSEKFTAVAVAVLLVLTAWGNAVAMFTVSLLGLVVALLLFRKQGRRGGILTATVGFVTALSIAVVIWLR